MRVPTQLVDRLRTVERVGLRVWWIATVLFIVALFFRNATVNYVVGGAWVWVCGFTGGIWYTQDQISK